MLTALSIRDVVLIETLDLEFGPGLGVLTGETGAGKSILLDALGLGLGARADSGLVRDGQPQAVVTVSFELPSAHPARAMLAENGLQGEPGEPLVIRRIVKADGGSRALVNDQSASVALLRDLGAMLVEIHGQHDDRGLLNPRGHRALLDSYGGLDTAAVSSAYRAVQEAKAALASARAEQDAAERDREWLEHAVVELQALAPEPGEEESLATLRATMQTGERLSSELATIAEQLEGSDGALSLLRQAARRLDRIAPEHETLADALAAIDRAVIEASEAEDKLARAVDELAFEPRRLEEAETRLFEIRAAARKHRAAPDDLPALLEELSARLDALQSGGGRLASLQAELASTQAQYDAAADALGAARAKAAERLDEAVAAELRPLKLDAARFRTALTRLTEGGESGCDRVEFEISTNPGAPFAPLVRIASGGELSRFILALKVALAQSGGATTMIFDEIDRGVGGAVASAIGERLHRLAETAQLLVVTHSPQVAARGKSHLLIEKSHQGLVTRTSVQALDEIRRREEIARMLSGAQVTDEARAQASRLLEPA
ncbi:MAG: DNA repair protein RecN [uncultured Sphingosinicella sp.]|uniref:DNA repair protein RecN n=1 Tax=uncultured Sphingosinicella sp. TaxID=478748 RepID=A0A6J4UDS5_9SPHN|nr:DNA repair protein RecN [uncultured Sphingosinicella sp.]CAA9545649.1 MAG: DNA repair protein RecN [uncultured Sphingosinicella sp.]